MTQPSGVILKIKVKTQMYYNAFNTINVIICITDHVNNKLLIFGLILFWFFLVIDSLSLRTYLQYNTSLLLLSIMLVHIVENPLHTPE